MRIKTSLMGGVAVGVMLAISATAPAYAKTADSTQSQLDDLRAQIQFLKDRLDEQAQISQKAQADVQSAKAQAAQAQAAAVQSAADLKTAQAQIIQTIPVAVDTAVAANKPKTDKIYYKGITIQMGGFLEAASIYRSRDETADMGSSYAKIPFNVDPAAHTGETRFSARQSRYTLLAQGNVSPDVVASFYGEFDFLGAAQTANSNESNSYQPRTRVLYGTIDWDAEGWHVLGGDNWSLVTLQNNGISPRSEVPPGTIDAQYVPGFAWARQPGFRLVKDFNKELWIGVSVEQPQTAGISGKLLSGVTETTAQAPTSQFYSGTNYSLNTVPDVIGKVAWEKKIGDQKVHIEGFGIMRQFEARINTTAAAALQLATSAGNTTGTTTGGGGGGSIAVYDVIPKHLDLQASFMGGVGIGRYGTSQLSDVTVRPDGSLIGIPETMWLVGGTFHANPMIDVYGYAGDENERAKTYQVGTTTLGFGTVTGIANASCLTESASALSAGTCSPFNKEVLQYTGGMWWKFYQGSFGRAQWGLQYSYTERKTFADTAGIAPKGTENMLFTSFRFYPF